MTCPHSESEMGVQASFVLAVMTICSHWLLAWLDTCDDLNLQCVCDNLCWFGNVDCRLHEIQNLPIRTLYCMLYTFGQINTF